MSLNYLDKIIPKRWVLLLYYYLPFYTAPTIFYFKCREFIDKLKHAGHQQFPLAQLADLLCLLEKYSINRLDKQLAQKIIYEIFTQEYKSINGELLSSLLAKFNPENNNAILKVALQKIPEKFYLSYFSTLNHDNCSAQTLKWCARLKDNFRMEDRLALILSLPDETLRSNNAAIDSLLIHDLQQQFIEHSLGPELLLSTSSHEQLSRFILNGKGKLIFPSGLIQACLNRWFGIQDPLLKSHIMTLDETTRFAFFENFLIDTENFLENIEYFFHLCPEEQWPTFINQLIEFIFKFRQPEMTDFILLNKKLKDNDPYSLVLTYLQGHAVTYRINLFQFLGMHSLTGKSFALEKLTIILTQDDCLLEHAKSFSLSCQEYIAENTIKTLKLFIKEKIMLNVPKENTRDSIQSRFNRFFRGDYSNTKPLDTLNIIIKKLPNELQVSFAQVLKILQQVLEALYQLLDSPAIANAKTQRCITWDRALKEEAYIFEARRELKMRLALGQQSQVSQQRMEELFGEDAATVQEQWEASLGTRFFDANDKEERKAALLGAVELIKLNREYTDIFSTSPTPPASSMNYLA